MEVRYMGFEQMQNARSYRFEVEQEGQPRERFTVTVDLSLFHTHGVGIQEGPALCAGKLASDLKNSVAGEHTLTREDLVSYTDARAALKARPAEKRKTPRRPASGLGTPSPWGDYRPRSQ